MTEDCMNCDEKIIMDDNGYCNWFYCESCSLYCHAGCRDGWTI